MKVERCSYVYFVHSVNCFVTYSPGAECCPGYFKRGGKFTENQYVKGCIKYYVAQYIYIYGCEYDIRKCYSNGVIQVQMEILAAESFIDVTP